MLPTTAELVLHCPACLARWYPGYIPYKILGAGNRVRTGDIFLGKEVLYQLSYTRMVVRLAGLEPARKNPGDFKSPAATNYATVALFGGVSRDRTYLPEATGLQPARTPLFHSLRFKE